MRHAGACVQGAAAAIALALANSIAVVHGWQHTQAVNTGHTGLIYGWASATTIPNYSRLEGAMIPRQCQAGRIIRPASQEEVVWAIKDSTEQCKKAGGRLSVRASRQLYHASSDILCPVASPSTPLECSVVLDMERLSEIQALDSGRMEVTAGPTVLLYSLMEWLEPQGMALSYQHLPFYSNLTLAGMLLTAAHGSSRTQASAFGNIVTRVTFVDGRGEVHTSSDVAPFIGSNGLYGVITQLVLKVVPLTKLKALPRRVHDRQLRASLQSFLADPRLALIQWLPDVRQAVVMTREPVDVHTPGNAVFQVLESLPLIAAGAGPSMGIQQVDNALLGNRLLVDDLPICLAEVLLIPYHRTEFTRVPIPFGLPAVGRLPNMVSSNCLPGPNFGCLWRGLVISLVEIDLDIKHLPAWMDDVRAVIAKSVPTCLPSVIGFAMRFGQASNNPLDMAYQRDTVYVDLVSNKAPHLVDAAASYQHVFDEIEQLSFCKYSARPHYGKNNNRVFGSKCPPINSYPGESGTLVTSMSKQYDPDGAFLSPLLSAYLSKQSLPKSPGCGVRGDCYCDTNDDCGPKYSCVPADTFAEFKVCKSQVLSLKHDLLARVRDALDG